MLGELKGLTTGEVEELQKRYGPNEISLKKRGSLRLRIKHIIAEPIYLLLAGSATIYFALGEMYDGLLMMAFVLFVIGIDVFQELRTGNALKKLRDYSEPKIKVIRDEKECIIPSQELVPGDIMLISEGVKIPADGWLLKANGLSVDESILTGESEGVWKYARGTKEGEKEGPELCQRDYCYSGTLVILGKGVVQVECIGNASEYGKIADTLRQAPRESSLLQKQLTKLAGTMTKIAGVLFILINLVTFFNLRDLPLQERLIGSLLAGAVLAISMVPGEFPVIQSVFLSMGALRLAKKNALVRSLSAVETLGAVSVLCVDKTGTITKNAMEVVEFWDPQNNGDGLCRAIALSCRENTFDPMETALVSYCDYHCQGGDSKIDCLKACNLKNSEGRLIKEYAFTNELKAIGQVWEFQKERWIAVKGSIETLLPLCKMTKELEISARDKIEELSGKGLRVIAVGERWMKEEEDIPEHLSDCHLLLRGIIGLKDPPREGIDKQIKACYQAGIRIVMITGDYPDTAVSIAKTIGIKNHSDVITGNKISGLTDKELQTVVKTCNLYARVLPLHKMRIVNALKENGEITAMTGDGVNDSPALKTADIGVAMGKHGSEVSREAADLILLDDNLHTILDSVQDGRRIYGNITKAIGYVVAVHLPIALISLAAPLLGISREAIMLLPIHIVLMELIMDPMVSIALERQPAEENVMSRPPRERKQGLLSFSLLMKSLLQGMVIFGASFSLYYGLLQGGYGGEAARTAGYSILVLSNVFLVLVNCSDTESIIHTLWRIRREKGIWLINGLIVLELTVMVYTPAAGYLKLTPLSPLLMIVVVCTSMASVLWYEAIKLWNRGKYRKTGGKD